MTQVSNEVLSMFAALQSEADNARVDTGSIPRPKAGEWPQMVRSISFETNGVTIKDAGGAVHPAWKATVYYKILPGCSPEDKVGMEWQGKPCVYPTKGVTSMPGDEQKGSKAQARMNLGRFKGILKAILGTAYSDNLAADVQAAQKLIASGNPVCILVKCQYDQGKKVAGSEAPAPIYFQEYGVRNLAAV